MARDEGGRPGVPGFVLPPSRNFGLRDQLSAADLGPLADVERTIVETAVLAQVVGQRGLGEGAWSRVHAESWERALRDANLFKPIMELRADAPPALASQLRAIRAALEEVRALEDRLGEDAEDGGTIARREHDGMIVGFCVAGVLTALAPGELRPLMAAGFGLLGGRYAWRAFGPRARVGRSQLGSARVALARAIQSFIEHTWVAAIGDRVFESTPHAIYLQHRLADLDAASGQSAARKRELLALIQRIRQANASLGREQDDAETRRLQRQLDELEQRIALVERLRADCAARSEAHLAQLDRQRAIAARRALSSRVSSLVSDDRDDATAVEIAVIEVDIADLAARMRGLEVEIGSADAELRSVLEVTGLGLGGGRAAVARPKRGP